MESTAREDVIEAARDLRVTGSRRHASALLYAAKRMADDAAGFEPREIDALAILHRTCARGEGRAVYYACQALKVLMPYSQGQPLDTPNARGIAYVVGLLGSRANDHRSEQHMVGEYVCRAIKATPHRFAPELLDGVLHLAAGARDAKLRTLATKTLRTALDAIDADDNSALAEHINTGGFIRRLYRMRPEGDVAASAWVRAVVASMEGISIDHATICATRAARALRRSILHAGKAFPTLVADSELGNAMKHVIESNLRIVHETLATTARAQSRTDNLLEVLNAVPE